VCPGMMGVNDEDLQKRIEGRHESLNKRLKIFACVREKYKGRLLSPQEKVDAHSRMFKAVCVVTQVAMELGYKQLYEV
jgi:hypothetical protein